MIFRSATAQACPVRYISPRSLMDKVLVFGTSDAGSIPAEGAMVFKLYILFSDKFAKTYVGYTSNLENRLLYHNTGKVKSTKSFKPWRIIYSEFAISSLEAKERERYWKSGAGRRKLKKIIAGSRPTFEKLGEARPI